MFEYSKSRTSQLFGEIVHRVDTNEKVVALTFDDGPNEYWPEIQQVLNEKETKATFYLIGSNIEENKEITQQIITDGHDVGNHSYTHPRFLLKGFKFVENEIEKTNQLIRESGYQNEITFRPPYGKKLFSLPRYLDQKNILTVTWDVEPNTDLPQDASSQEISKYVKDNVKPGSIILLHPWYGETNTSREAIGLIIDELKKDGYRFVTVNELLKF